MATIQYTAKVEEDGLLSLPKEAHQELGLKPGDLVDVTFDTEEGQERQAKRRVSALGKYAFVPGGSEEFARQKQEEIEREDRPRS